MDELKKLKENAGITEGIGFTGMDRIAAEELGIVGEVPANVQRALERAYDAGYEAGNESGFEQGVEQSQYQ